MQRDMELIRQILLAIEATPNETLPEEPTITGSSDRLVAYHLALLRQAGLIEMINYEGEHRIVYGQIGLAWQGHEFLAAARDSDIWQKAKTRLGGIFSTVTLALLQELLISEAKRRLGLP